MQYVFDLSKVWEYIFSHFISKSTHFFLDDKHAVVYVISSQHNNSPTCLPSAPSPGGPGGPGGPGSPVLPCTDPSGIL